MKTRRGLSTVVGMVFAIIALSTTVAYVSYSMNTLNQYNNAILVKNQGLADTSKENFKIASVTLAGSKLNITLANTGSVPINFTKIWVQNTTTTNWVYGYTPGGTKGFVSPGATLTNLGQQIPLSIKSTNSYNVKLVTSRGTNQAFTVNSASAVPLNIQMMFLPPTVSSGFKSELMMVVINNSTGTLTNISPSSLPLPTYGVGNTGNLQCNPGSVSPASYATLAPGNVAFFTWDITTTAGNGGDTCTYSYTSTPPLKNGYLQTVSPPTPLTISVVSLASTTYALNSGVITLTYTSFKWTQGNNAWNNDWGIPNCKTTDFSITFTNNNQTTGGYSLWLSKNTQMLLTPTYYGTGNSVHVPYTYFITKIVYPNNMTLKAYSPDYFQGITNQGGSATVYFGADSAGSSTQPYTGNNCLATGTYYGIIVLYGKFTVNSGDNTGGMYAQNLPFMAVVVQ